VDDLETLEPAREEEETEPPDPKPKRIIIIYKNGLTLPSPLLATENVKKKN